MVVTALLLAVLAGCDSPAISTGEVSGRITINGQPVEGVVVAFIPQSKTRPAIATTDAAGHYEAQLLADQAGVPLGPCLVQLSLFREQEFKNYLPAKFNEQAADNPDLNLVIGEDGLVFDYDIQYDGALPPGI